jgi:hypothetical protein
VDWLMDLTMNPAPSTRTGPLTASGVTGESGTAAPHWTRRLTRVPLRTQ